MVVIHLMTFERCRRTCAEYRSQSVDRTSVQAISNRGRNKYCPRHPSGSKKTSVWSGVLSGTHEINVEVRLSYCLEHQVTIGEEKLSGCSADETHVRRLSSCCVIYYAALRFLTVWWMTFLM